MQNEYTIIDLFAGCGGLSLGAEQAGFRPIFVNELNPHAMASYLTNRSHSVGGLRFSENPDLHISDVHQLKGKRLLQLQADLKNIGVTDFSFVPRRPTNTGSTIDIIAGGPPCQGYSGIGYRRSFSVEKEDIPANELYLRMVAILKNLRPRVFLFENVQGLLTSTWVKGGTRKIWPDVLSAFRGIPGYEVRWSLLRSYDYGVPQNRPRVLLVGIRKDILQESSHVDATQHPEDAVACGFLPAPQPGEFPHLIDLLGDLEDPEVLPKFLESNYPKGRFITAEYPFAPQSEIQKTLRLCPPPNQAASLTDHEYSKHKAHVVKRFRHMQRNDGIIPPHLKTKKFAQRVTPPKWGPSGPNITATSLPDDYIHYSQPRTFTVREWARLQLFPDWYQFRGPRTTGGQRRAGNPRAGNYNRDLPKYTQIGNAVPVELARRVAGHLREIIDDYLGLHKKICQPRQGETYDQPKTQHQG